jgi:hypothetical protein
MRNAQEYIDTWSTDDRGWLRRFYPEGSDEPHFDLTPSAAKAMRFLGTLGERAFIGTESRLLTLFNLLREMHQGSEVNIEVRVAELQRRRDEIDAEIARTLSPEGPKLFDETAMLERYQLFLQTAHDLMDDFREVESNFRRLDRRARERIARWEGGKGDLLEEILGERDAITNSDQGRSFRAYWDFLLSTAKREEVAWLLDAIHGYPAIAARYPNTGMRLVHHRWIDTGAHAQRTVAGLSKQLRRFLDDQAWLENRRITELLRKLEAVALDVRDAPPENGAFLDDIAPMLSLPFERRLYVPPLTPHFSNEPLEMGRNEDVNTQALFDRSQVERAVLEANIRRALRTRSQVSMAELSTLYPFEFGLAELVMYRYIASQLPAHQVVVDEAQTDVVAWDGHDADGIPVRREARLHRVLFLR